MQFPSLTKLFAAFLLAAPLALVGCGESATPEQRLAVTDAMEEFFQAFGAQYTVNDEEDLSMDELRERFIDQLGEIDVSACPEDFQEAWGTYRVELAQAPAPSEQMAAGFRMISDNDSVADAAFEDSQRLGRDAQRASEAMQALLEIAAEYDRATARFIEDTLE